MGEQFRQFGVVSGRQQDKAVQQAADSGASGTRDVTSSVVVGHGVLSAAGTIVELPNRGHDADKTRVFISGQKRGITPTIRRERRRRSAIEPVIGT